MKQRSTKEYFSLQHGIHSDICFKRLVRGEISWSQNNSRRMILFLWNSVRGKTNPEWYKWHHWLPRVRTGWGRINCKEVKELAHEMEIFYILIGVVVTWAHAFVKNKYIKINVCEGTLSGGVDVLDLDKGFALHRWTHLPKLIKWHTDDLCSSLRVNFTSERKKIVNKNWTVADEMQAEVLGGNIVVSATHHFTMGRAMESLTDVW